MLELMVADIRTGCEGTWKEFDVLKNGINLGSVWSDPWGIDVSLISPDKELEMNVTSMVEEGRYTCL